MQNEEGMNDYEQDDFIGEDFDFTDEEQMPEPVNRAGQNCMRKIELARERLTLRRELTEFNFALD